MIKQNAIKILILLTSIASIFLSGFIIHKENDELKYIGIFVVHGVVMSFLWDRWLYEIIWINKPAMSFKLFMFLGLAMSSGVFFSLCFRFLSS